MLSSKQYCSISNGSACTSKSYTPSYVLEAMVVPTDEIENSIRVSWGADINIEEFKNSFGQLIQVAKRIAF